MCDSHYYVLGKEGEMFEDREIIPKCFNGLDSKTVHLYNLYKMFMEMFIICQN